MSPDQYKTEQFRKDLKRILSLIATSRRFLDEGKVVELAALETRVADLCNQAKGLNPEDRQSVTPHLAALTEELGALETHMQQEYSDLQRQLRGISTTVRATNAYAQASRTR